MVHADNSFTIDSFFVREVTTRYQYSIYDVWAAIGGLYGGSLLILSMLFTVASIPELTEVKVFRFLQQLGCVGSQSFPASALEQLFSCAYIFSVMFPP